MRLTWHQRLLHRCHCTARAYSNVVLQTQCPRDNGVCVCVWVCVCVCLSVYILILRKCVLNITAISNLQLSDVSFWSQQKGDSQGWTLVATLPISEESKCSSPNTNIVLTCTVHQGWAIYRMLAIISQSFWRRCKMWKYCEYVNIKYICLLMQVLVLLVF